MTNWYQSQYEAAMEESVRKAEATLQQFRCMTMANRESSTNWGENSANLGANSANCVANGAILGVSMVNSGSAMAEDTRMRSLEEIVRRGEAQLLQFQKTTEVTQSSVDASLRQHEEHKKDLGEMKEAILELKKFSIELKNSTDELRATTEKRFEQLTDLVRAKWRSSPAQDAITASTSSGDNPATLRPTTSNQTFMQDYVLQDVHYESSNFSPSDQKMDLAIGDEVQVFQKEIEASSQEIEEDSKELQLKFHSSKVISHTLSSFEVAVVEVAWEKMDESTEDSIDTGMADVVWNAYKVFDEMPSRAITVMSRGSWNFDPGGLDSRGFRTKDVADVIEMENVISSCVESTPIVVHKVLNVKEIFENQVAHKVFVEMPNRQDHLITRLVEEKKTEIAIDDWSQYLAVSVVFDPGIATICVEHICSHIIFDQPYCDHCRCCGWSNHFVSKRRYHIIIPADDEWKLPLNEDFLDAQNHLLHGLVHSNGVGHLLCINGTEGGSKIPHGREIMDLWDGICTNLHARKISVEDESKKRAMHLRLLHGVAYGHPRFGRWGYHFCSGGFGMEEHHYKWAIGFLSSMYLEEIIAGFRPKKITQLTTFQELLRYMLTIKFRVLPRQKIVEPQKPKCVVTSFFVAMPGADVYGDINCLYKHVLMGFPERESAGLAARVILDSKQFVME